MIKVEININDFDMKRDMGLYPPWVMKKLKHTSIPIVDIDIPKKVKYGKLIHKYKKTKEKTVVLYEWQDNK